MVLSDCGQAAYRCTLRILGNTPRFLVCRFPPPRERRIAWRWHHQPWPLHRVRSKEDIERALYLRYDQVNDPSLKTETLVLWGVSFRDEYWRNILGDARHLRLNVIYVPYTLVWTAVSFMCSVMDEAYVSLFFFRQRSHRNVIADHEENLYFDKIFQCRGNSHIISFVHVVYWSQSPELLTVNADSGMVSANPAGIPYVSDQGDFPTRTRWKQIVRKAYVVARLRVYLIPELVRLVLAWE